MRYIIGGIGIKSLQIAGFGIGGERSEMRAI